MKIRLAAPLTTESIVDGPGLRTVLWCQGCPHHCEACQNPQTHALNGGGWVDVEKVVANILAVPLQSGVTFSGGEPMLQPEACLAIAQELKVRNLNLWCYTGYRFEELLERPECVDFLRQLDVLVDGPFINNQKSYDLMFCGSANQRLIDLKASLAAQQVILYQS